MGFCKIRCCLILVVCLSLFTAISASNFISDGAFGSSVLGERRLLQAQRPCTVNFELQNYTIITSRCRGPQYPPSECCSAFRDFACPYAVELNDLGNNCAETMFSYINIHGRYPPGLFANECRDSRRGLECPALPPSQSDNSNNNSGDRISRESLPIMMFALASLAFSLRFM